MKKLMLRLNDLKIETFVTAASVPTQGTVAGYAATAFNTCPDTCMDSCFNTNCFNDCPTNHYVFTRCYQP